MLLGKSLKLVADRAPFRLNARHPGKLCGVKIAGSSFPLKAPPS